MGNLGREVEKFTVLQILAKPRFLVSFLKLKLWMSLFRDKPDDRGTLKTVMKI